MAFRNKRTNVYSDKTTDSSVPAISNEKVTASKKNNDVATYNQLVDFERFGLDVASAATLVITSGVNKVTGTTTISNIDTTNLVAGESVVLLFESALLLEHAAGGTGQMYLNNGADYTTSAGKVLEFVLQSDGAFREKGSSLALLVVHNETTGKEGGDGTKFFHLGETAYNAASLLDVSGGVSDEQILQYNAGTGKFVAANTSGIDSAAIHTNVASEISTLTEKASPVDADIVVIEDSEDSNNKKKVQVVNLGGGGLWQIGGGVEVGTTNLITKGTVEIQSQSTDDILTCYDSSNNLALSILKPGHFITNSDVTYFNLFLTGVSLTAVTGEANTIIVSDTAVSLTTGSNNTMMGRSSGIDLETGSKNTLYGVECGANLVSTDQNTMMGFQCGLGATGLQNTLYGDEAGAQQGAGDYNTKIGASCGIANTGNFNVLTGTLCLDSGTGQRNTAHGYSCLQNAGASSYQAGLGFEAGKNGSGDYRICIGYQAGYYETGASSLMVSSLTSAQQVNEATARTKAIIYAVQSATTANQKLTINAQLNVSQLPTSASGLISGDIWNNGGVLNIV